MNVINVQFTVCYNSLHYRVDLGRNTTTVKPLRDTTGHKAAGCWVLSSTLGILGTAANSLVLTMFFQERKTLFKGVNAMIWYCFV